MAEREKPVKRERLTTGEREDKPSSKFNKKRSSCNELQVQAKFSVKN